MLQDDTVSPKIRERKKKKKDTANFKFQLGWWQTGMSLFKPLP
jgi:hypothetical protein